MGYRVIFNFDNGTTEDMLDKVFETIEDAEYAAQQEASDYSQGRDYSDEAYEPSCDENIVDWSIVEVDD